MKHYSLSGSDGSERPFLLFEVKIDLHDIRSGCSLSDSGWYYGEWIEGREDENWTQDMVGCLDPSQLLPQEPPRQLEWPAWADEEIIRYLMRYYRPEVWKNYELRLYSDHEETREEFVDRCREVLMPERLEEMRKLREVFLHRFFEMEQRLISSSRDETLDEDVQIRRVAGVAEVFSEVREDLSRIFVEDDFRLLGDGDLKWELSDPDARDRLLHLRADLVERYNEISSRIEERACRVERYRVTAPRSAFEIVTRSVLWQ